MGPGWRTCASDEEGLIEAIEREGDAFVIGVQWHPELSPAGGVQDRLFDGLVEAARIHSVTRANTALTTP